MHARLEIAVARKDGGRDEIVFADRVFDCGRQGAGVADARRAAVTHEVEAELVEIHLQAGPVQIIAHHARAGRERRLDDGIHAEPALHGLLRQQTGGEHDAGIRRVRATRDGRDEHAAVANFGLHPAKRRSRHLLRSVGRGMLVAHLGFAGIHAQLAMAIAVINGRMSLPRRVDPRGYIQFLGTLAEAIVHDRMRHRLQERAFQLRQFDAVLRALRAGHAGNHRAEVEFQLLRVGDVAFLRNAPKPLCLVIIFVGRQSSSLRPVARR